MPLFALDTDTLTHFRTGHPKVLARVAAVPRGDVVSTVISLEEQLAGWYSRSKNAKTPALLEHAYRKLADVVEFFRDLRLLPLTVNAIARYQAPHKLHLNVGKNDLRIAAIAPENYATVVTANVRDFGRVPGLVVEDWTA
jgi:tRNA(fMet)-specific endonuclease VapC